MKRFIRYLYEYQDGKRTRNTGFVKYDEQERTATIQIYGRGFPVADGQTLEIYLFLEEDGNYIGIFMGEIKGAQAAFGYKLSYTTDDVGGAGRFRQILGIILRTGSGTAIRYYGAVWEEDGVDITKMIPEKEWKIQPEMQKNSNESDKEAKPEQEETVISEQEEQKQTTPGKPEEGAEQKIEELEKEEVQGKDTIYKITRQELAGLPRKEWKLANNHFLLHGYYNYHHLVSFEKEGKCWIGVPGLYFPGEQRAAAAFGFSQFMKPAEGELKLEEYEIEDEERFGYWCRPVGAVIRKEIKEKTYAEDIDRGRKIHEGSNQAGEEGMED